MDDVIKSSESIARIIKAGKMAELKEIILDAYTDNLNDSDANRDISSTIQGKLFLFTENSGSLRMPFKYKILYS